MSAKDPAYEVTSGTLRTKRVTPTKLCGWTYIARQRITNPAVAGVTLTRNRRGSTDPKPSTHIAIVITLWLTAPATETIMATARLLVESRLGDARPGLDSYGSGFIVTKLAIRASSAGLENNNDIWVGSG